MSDQIIDISPIISENIAVFPGDKTFERKVSLSIKDGNNIDLSSINSTVHLGAHTDAPNHYHKDGCGIDQVDLGRYYGPCQVIQAKGSDTEGRIRPEDISHQTLKCQRILLKTQSFPNPNKWNDDFWSLHPDTIKYLSESNVVLIGIDTPSVDPANDQDLKSHTEIYKNRMSILEGIVLTNVEEGQYKLIALPLKIKDADASPVRAVLIC